jgi:hypothetical protein
VGNVIRQLPCLAETWDCVPSNYFSSSSIHALSTAFLGSQIAVNRFFICLNEKLKDIKDVERKRGDALYSFFGHRKMSSIMKPPPHMPQIAPAELSHSLPRIYPKIHPIPTLAEKYEKMGNGKK